MYKRCPCPRGLKTRRTTRCARSARPGWGALLPKQSGLYLRPGPPAPACYRSPVGVLALAPQPRPVTVLPWGSLPTPQSSTPLLEKLQGQAGGERRWGWPPTPQRPHAHLREQRAWTGLRSRDRHPPVWKSHRRSMLGGRAWAEASSEPLPSSARAETWGGGRLRDGAQPAGASPPGDGPAVPTLSVWPRKKRCSRVSTCRTTMTAWQGYTTAAPSLVHRACARGPESGVTGRLASRPLNPGTPHPVFPGCARAHTHTHTHTHTHRASSEPRLRYKKLWGSDNETPEPTETRGKHRTVETQRWCPRPAPHARRQASAPHTAKCEFSGRRKRKQPGQC